METGWEMVDEKWYHFNSDGTMSIGWVKDKDTWYYMNFSGQMETGTIGIDGKVYTFSASGAMINGKETTQEMQSDTKDVVNAKNNTSNKTEENIVAPIGTGNNDNKTRIGYVSTNNDSLIFVRVAISSQIIGTVAKNKEVKIIGDEENGFYPTTVKAINKDG